ncbi:hypothetical protein J1605_017990 [Eschrichtius robustus]|uniref:Regulation of nuclear pre-mRNA domain-containing protein n=1 Tax=Eschrichtius robustus TaxID=9764 RepID=A0AB34HZ67_ESCRO|nr:hypothetical protein J1605_017990 [Eschrichtius robustus]
MVPKVAADLSAEILQARKEWHDAFKVTKGKNLQPRIPSKTHSDLMEKSKALQTSNRSFPFFGAGTEEYKRKLARVSLVRKELRSRIQSLPDLSRLPNVTGSHMHLPFAGDIYSED